MAAQAVLRIREAEQESREILTAAGEQARLLRREAAGEGARKGEAILAQARQARESLLANARQKAQAQADEQALRGEAERAALLTPPQERFDKAVALVMERIVWA